jgi:hypothetical protein
MANPDTASQRHQSWSALGTRSNLKQNCILQNSAAGNQQSKRQRSTFLLRILTLKVLG